MENNMTTAELIEALKKLNPDSNVVINIIQKTKSGSHNGVVQLPIKKGSAGELYWWVNQHFGGSITVHLPKGAYIAKLPK
jgi:hypothetical protein